MMDLAEQLKALTQHSQKKSYWRAYQLKRIQRFLLITAGTFFLHYLILVHFTPMSAVLPLYPPFGSAFIILYWVGNVALCGLFLASFCTYCVLGYDFAFLLGYLSADVGVAYVCSCWCLTIFTSDHAVFTDIRAWGKLGVYASLSCGLSGLLRLLVHQPYSLQHFFSLWLADLNALLVFAGFFLTWIIVYLGRERVLHRKKTLFDTLVGLVWAGSCILFLQNILALALVVGCSLYLAKRFGLLIAMVVSYVVATFFLIDVIFQQTLFLAYLGSSAYFLIPGGVFCFLLGMLYLGLSLRQKISC